MKLMKRVLSVFLAMLLLSSASVLTMAETTTHTIDVSEETTIAAIDYASAKVVYKKSGVEHILKNDVTVVDNRIEFEKSWVDGSSTRSLTTTITYTVNIQKTGYYRFKMRGMYKTSAPSIYVSVDGGEEVLASNTFKLSDANIILTYLDIAAGQHSVSFKFTGGGASIESIYLRNMQKDVGSSITQIPIVDYISTNNTSGTRDYSSNGVRYCIPVNSEESGNLGASSGLNNKYRINVAESGQYRVSAWSARRKETIYADVSIVGADGRSIIARGIGEPKTSVTSTSPVTTSSFNLEAGTQNLHLRFHCVNKDPIQYEDTSIFLYYIELEKIDSIQEVAELSESSKTEIEPENIFYTDDGITLDETSVTISADKIANFYVNAPSAGNYAFSIKYKAQDNTSVLVNSLTTDIYKNTLIPTDGEFLTYTLGVSNLNAGENRINITPDKDLEIEKIYINKISDESSLDAINAATTEDEIETAISAAQTALDVELTEATNGIFYKKPVYNRLLKKDYATISEFVKEYNKALISEYNNTWVTLYIDDVKKIELATGDIKLTASTGYVPKGSTMIAALYENIGDGVKRLYKFAICEEISQNTYDFLFGETEINPENSYTLEFFYWDGLTDIRPIDVFDSVYEEIYVSTTGNDTAGDGTEENPYATIEKALEKVAEINDYQWGDIIVNVKGGTYTLTETIVIDEKHSGKNGYNVIIRGEENNQPVVSGGIKVTKWEPHSGNIWKAPLSGVDYARNLYVNGYPAVMARSDRHYDTAIEVDNTIPTTVYRCSSSDGGSIQPAEVYDIALTEASTGLSLVAEFEDDCGFTMSIDELGTDFDSPVGMEFVWPYTFENHITPVTGYSKSGDHITFYMNEELLKRRESTIFKSGNTFYLQNAKELINNPGEFCYDKQDGYIYYYPYSYEDMNTAETYIGNVEGMVKVAGSSLTSKVENITFENLAFRYGAYNFISKYGYIGSQTDGILVPFEWSEGKIAYMAQFAVDNADNINITGCEFSCLGSAAISMIDSVSNSSINGNIIRDISGTGIRIGHPIHNRQRDGVEVCRNIDITNNVIRRIASEMFNNSAIVVYYEKFINILHNDIKYTPYSGISAGWGWGGGSAYDHSNINISYNKIESIMNSLHDGGAIYTLGPMKNSVISNNYLKDHNSRNSGGMIYQDQGSAFIEVFNNVILDAVLALTFNVSSTNTNNLKYYNNYSDTGTQRKLPDDWEDRNLHQGEHIIVTGEGESLSDPRAVEIYQNAGLESEYKSLLSKYGVEMPEAGRDLRITLPKPAPTEEIMFSSTAYDKETSSPDLEMTNYADGIGTSITGTEYINYKLDIPESGYYGILLWAIGAGETSRNGIEVGGDAKEVKMFTDGSQLTNSQLIFGNTKFRKYRVCTAYFEKGEQDLTFTVTDPEDKIIIKEVYYRKLLQDIKPNGRNTIEIRAFSDVIGLDSNTMGNDVSSYPPNGLKYYVKGCVCASGNKTVTLTYKLNVEEAGTYKVGTGSWVGKNGPLTYQILIDGEVKSEGTTKIYSSLHKGEDTQLSDIELPAGEVEIQLKAINGPSTSYMYYLTFEKTN